MYTNLLSFLQKVGVLVPLSMGVVHCGLQEVESEVLDAQNANMIDFTLVHTNDLHSSFEGTGPDSLYRAGDASSPVRGGFARVASVISSIRSQKAAQGETTLVVDAGDFYAGSLFHMLAPLSQVESVPELEFLSLVGYDAVVLGNHEFDAGPTGLATMLGKARAKGLQVPLVSTNLKQETLPTALRPYVSTVVNDDVQVVPTRLKRISTRGGSLAVGFVGVLGLDAAQLSIGSRGGIGIWGFNDQKNKPLKKEFYANIRTSVASLQAQGADVIVALLHGGPAEGEQLGKAVSDIDVVIGSHTHDVILTSEHGHIYAQAGALGEHVGVLSLRFARDSKKVSVRADAESGVRVVDGTVGVDSAVEQLVLEAKEQIGAQLVNLGFAYDAPIVTVRHDSLPRDQSLDPFSRFAVTKVFESLQQRMHKPVDLYFATRGIIRGGFRTNRGQPVLYQLSDVFKIFSLGFDDAGKPGSSVVTFYLQKKEFKKLLEISEAYAMKHEAAFPVTSENVTYSINRFGIPMVNRVANLRLNGVPYADWPELIHLGTNAIVAGFFDKFSSIPFGLADVKPRDALGMPLARVVPAGVPAEYILFSEGLRRMESSDL